MPELGSERAARSILLIEDDQDLCSLMADYFAQHGVRIEAAHDGRVGLARALAGGFDLVILDVMLPLLDGFEVLRQIRKRSETPVIMLTARTARADRVAGLDTGADDYLPKPFDFAELVARIRALGRRAATPIPPRLECGDVMLDPSARAAFRAGRRLGLSPKELAVLECLLSHAGAVISTEELLEQVWDEAANPFTNTVKTTIGRLRAKLGDPPVIETVREGGYRITAS
jgi:DNA-binding response OmpR family regulator